MANEHTIRVSARGEFGNLQTGLKNLQRDLKSVLGEIDKGARRGGLFDETQLRALDVYRTRFKATMDVIDREMRRQNDTIDQLHRRRQNSADSEHAAIDKEIRKREKSLDALRRQIRMVEELYRARDKEAKSFGTYTAPATGGMPMGGASSSSGLMGGAMAKALGMGKFMVGLAGIGGIASMAQQAYSLAYASQTTPMNLSQRIRGYGYTGSAKGMWDDIGQIGRNSSMGYTSGESWQFMDAYSRQAGGLNRFGLEHALMFGRSYGLEVGETAGSLGSNRALGGAGSAQEFANMIAASVGSSGMTPRILEVMETSNGLLEQMNTSLKDGGSKNILAYQTILDSLGTKNGMMRLTGQQGANIISGLGGIFNPNQENQWKWMGIQALQQYNPKKYGGMGLYDLESSFESGLENTDNVAAMATYLRGKSGGNANTMKRMMQRWLQDGGYNATKQQVNDLYDVTDGFTAFDSSKVNGVMGSLSAGDGTAKYQERMGQLGQDILDTNARFEKQLENLGQPLLTVVQGIKEGITGILEELNNDGLTGGIEKLLGDIKKFMDDHLTETILAGALAGALLGSKLLGGGGGGGSGKSKGGFFGLFGGISKPLGLAALALGIPYFGSKILKSDGMDSFMNNLFPKKPRTKEEEEAFQNAADPKNKKMQWYEWANPSKWGTGFGKLFSGDTTPAKELAKKNGWKDPDAAIDSLKKLGDSGLVNITGLTDLGKQKLDELAKQGVIKISEGQTLATTTLSGFTEAGKAQLQALADSGAITLSGFQTDGTAKITALSAEGVAKLEEMKTRGTITISDFKQEGTLQITELSKEGAKKLSQLEKNGSISLTSMDLTTQDKLEEVRKTTKTNLGDVLNEHKELKDKTVGKDGFFAKIFDGFGKWWEDMLQALKDMLPSWLGGGDSSIGLGGFGANYDIRTKSGVSAGQLNSKFGGALSGQGAAFVAAGAKYGIDPAVLAAIAMHETGNGTSSAVRNKNNVGGMMGKNGLMTFGSIGAGIDAFASNLKRNYLDKGLYTIADIQKKYAPLGASNDPNGLNKYWIGRVTEYLNSFGVANAASSGNFFAGWQNRVTSRFGSTEGFRGTPHGGLDINGEQGDALQALRNGTIAFIKYDDGSSRDEDGRANTRAGGTELGIKTEDGKIYFYSHLSNVASGLKVGGSVQAGQYVGNVGGDPGKAGSGNSTTGSHLHLGLLDSAGNRINPEPWLKGLNAGDSDIGMVESGTTVKRIEVAVTLEGDGVGQLNAMTESALQKLITQAIQNYEAQKLLLNPSIG